MLISRLYHWKGISLFYYIGIRNVDYDLSITESSYSITRLQSRKNSFRIHSKFLRIFFFFLFEIENFLAAWNHNCHFLSGMI